MLERSNAMGRNKSLKAGERGLVTCVHCPGTGGQLSACHWQDGDKIVSSSQCEPYRKTLLKKNIYNKSYYYLVFPFK